MDKHRASVSPCFHQGALIRQPDCKILSCSSPMLHRNKCQRQHNQSPCTFAEPFIMRTITSVSCAVESLGWSSIWLLGTCTMIICLLREVSSCMISGLGQRRSLPIHELLSWVLPLLLSPAASAVYFFTVSLLTFRRRYLPFHLGVRSLISDDDP